MTNPSLIQHGPKIIDLSFMIGMGSFDSQHGGPDKNAVNVEQRTKQKGI